MKRRRPFLALVLGAKQQSFSWLSDDAVLCEYVVPSEGPISHSAMARDPRWTLSYIATLLKDGYQTKKETRNDD